MKLAGLVLAGGRSTRMGGDKARLRINGVTLLEQAEMLLAAAGARRVYVAGREDVPFGLPDQEAYAGPAMATVNALNILHNDGFTHALVLPVDMPLMTETALRSLIMAEAPAVSYATQPLPFFASLQAVMELKCYPVSLKRLLRELNARQIPMPESDLIFVNTNTPEEWESVRSRLETD